MKKSQTATEYLIILAVVIIIALIVVGVMGGIPFIQTDRNVANKYCRSKDYAYAVNVTFDEISHSYHIVCERTTEEEESFTVHEAELETYK